MDIPTVKIIIIVVTLVGSTIFLRKYRNIPALNLTLLCFIAFQMIIKDWTDFLFLIGVGCVLLGINMEFVKVYKRLEDLESKGHGSDI